MGSRSVRITGTGNDGGLSIRTVGPRCGVGRGIGDGPGFGGTGAAVADMNVKKNIEHPVMK